ncbi:MAG: AAA family ATPase [Planctomycetota bacterium]
MLRVGKSDVSISDYVLNDSGPYFGNANPYLSNVSRYWEEKPNRLPLGIAEKVFDELRDHFQRMRAIGAFRQSPLRRYEFQGSSNLPDPAGANVIAAIIADSLREGRAERNRLLKAINQWMDRVGQVRLMPVRRISKIARLYELRLRDTDSGRWANFADVGFGIAQALPVIVEGLRTPEGAMFLVQEPEIHLHPDAQLAMADYLVGLVKARRGVIVETHSEHMVLRFRNLLLSNARNGRSAPKLKPEEVSFVYVDKDKTGKSHARALELDNLAQFKDWPKDFMEEASRERLDILEKMARRMNK